MKVAIQEPAGELEMSSSQLKVEQVPKERVAHVREVGERLADEIEKAIVGKRERVIQTILALLCGGHILLEDIPGVGKTTLAKALAQAIGGDFRRVQFTPDLLPSDITGSSVFNQARTAFEFRAGPVFGNVVLADEINRATPKTQSALLEAMEEHQVTTDGESRQLPAPFFVIATQNSVEMTGTYPLPEAQLDRFFMRISLGYPSRSAEASILAGRMIVQPLEMVKLVTSLDELKELQKEVREVFVHESIIGYIVDIIRATRASSSLLLGASPRGSLHLMRASQASAALKGEIYVRPDDVKDVAPYVLGHRVFGRVDSRMRVGTSNLEPMNELINEIVNTVPVPMVQAN